MVSTTQKLLAIAAHISYLLGGAGYLFVPLLIFLLRRDDPFTAAHARQALCVQVVIGLLGGVVSALMFVLVGFLLVPVLVLLGLLWLGCSLLGAWRALNGEDYSYPLIGSLVERLDD
jgi:hypothetical protein